MEAIATTQTGREARPSGQSAGVMARLTAPLRAAMAGHYQDRYVAAQAARPNRAAAILASLGERLSKGVAWLQDKARAAWSWVTARAAAVGRWIAAAISRAFAVFQRTPAEQEQRRREEAAYLEKLEERKAQAKRQASADAAAVAALATDSIRAPLPGGEKHQLVDNGTLERRRMRRVLTGRLPA